MTRQFMTQPDLAQWLSGLLDSHTVIAPVRSSGQVVFAPVQSVGEIVWESGRTDLSAKEFFLPASEAILTLHVQPDGIRLEQVHLERPQVLVGARPCDAHALEVLDRLFLDDPIDVYYAERRAATTLVGLACTGGPWTGCFCTTLGGGPDDRSHLDVLLTAVEGGYAVDVVTDKGAELLAGASLRPLAATIAPPDAPPALRLAPPDAWRAQFDAPYWAELAARCLSCRVCTYDCPVCYCFDLRDRITADGGIERLRCWDSCQGVLCFAIAGGHNPRPTAAARQRQRYMHKFLYYPEREGTALCVGCGRCVTQCPVNIDIREVITTVAELETAGQPQEVRS